MNPFNRPNRRRPPDRPPEPPARPSADDLIDEMNRELRDNPTKRKKVKATEDLTIADVRTATEDLEKLRSLFKKELQQEVEKELRAKLRTLTRRNPDVTIDEYLADEVRDEPDEGEEDDDDRDAA
jgi:hypothetical protein